MHVSCSAPRSPSWPSSCARHTGPVVLVLLAGLAAVSGVRAQKLAAPPAAVASTGVATADLASTQALALDHRILAEAKSNSEILKNLTYLSDEIGPRLTGSAALKRANEWTAEKMRGYGLSNVHLEKWTIPVGWERGPATARIVEPQINCSLILAAEGWTPGTNGKVLGDVVVVNAKNIKELQGYKGKLHNAIVLQGPPHPVRPITEKGWPQLWSGPAPAREKPKTPTPSANGKPLAEPKTSSPARPAATGQGQNMFAEYLKWMVFRKEYTNFLKREGAAALLQDAGKPHALLSVSGSWMGNDRATAVDGLPNLAVAHEHYALLYRLASRPSPARTRVEIEVQNKIIPGPIVVYNTVGEIRGSEKPDEYVVLGAHLDSWDLAQGTTDNGTGSMVVLEAARILSRLGVPPRRTIRFVLFTGEEQGLYGSRAYVQQHKDEMARISMCLCHDTGTGRVESIGLHGCRAAKSVLDRELLTLKELGIDELTLRSLPGSDHMSFNLVGVPGFLFEQNLDEYFLSHHSQSDTLDKVREPDLIQGAQAMALTGLRVANLPMLLPRGK